MKQTLLPGGIYEGVVRHARMQPQLHRFEYKVAMVYLDLDELSAQFCKSPFWSL